MRRAILMAVVMGLAAGPAIGASGSSLRGAYVEARTAEVFTGGCIVNGEAGTTGKEALLAWKVDRGSFKGVALDGLSVAAAVVGSCNLGIQEIGGEIANTRAAVFVDQRATPAQQKALVAMANELSKGALGTVVQQTPAAIQFVDDGKSIRVVSNSLRLVVAKELSHDPTCGAKQWFNPLSSVDEATLGTTAENSFLGTALGTKWSDPNKRSSFFGTFSY